jgi:hypothetical protein
VTSAIVMFRIVSVSSCPFLCATLVPAPIRSSTNATLPEIPKDFSRPRQAPLGWDRVKEEPFRIGRVLNFVGESVRIESAVVLLFGLPLANR